MYKTCFECPHISYQNRRGRNLYWCSKLSKITGHWFYLDKKGTGPKICPLLKRNKLCKNLWAKLKGGK